MRVGVLTTKKGWRFCLPVEIKRPAADRTQALAGANCPTCDNSDGADLAAADLVRVNLTNVAQ
jgi:hypothetical protein